MVKRLIGRLSAILLTFHYHNNYSSTLISDFQAEKKGKNIDRMSITEVFPTFKQFYRNLTQFLLNLIGQNCQVAMQMVRPGSYITMTKPRI